LENSAYFDALIKVPGESALGSFHYIPILFCENNRINKYQKLLIAYQAYVIGSVQKRMPQYAQIIYGLEKQKARVKIDKQIQQVHKIIQEIQKQQNFEAPTWIILNSHCNMCEFQVFCKDKAIEQDSLSLLSGIGSRELRQQNKKGIFTVTQYSYTFRPRKRNKRVKGKRTHHYGALKALAIRENKIFIYGKPELPSCEVSIYMDIEGEPEQGFDYLVGLVIVESQLTKHYSFWADDQQDEKRIFVQLLEILRKYRDYHIFHYGSYEVSFLKRMNKKLDEESRKEISEILGKCVDIFSTIRSSIYLPTYTNKLKDIGRYLGFNWTSEKASGIQSLIWRRRWEITRADELKQMLIQYNIEDCLALKRATDFIHSISSNPNQESFQDVKVVQAQDLATRDEYEFKKQVFVNTDLDYINKCSYFDYQREKVFVRTNENLGKIQLHKKRKTKCVTRINEHIVIKSSQCPRCENSQLYVQKYSKKRDVLDLKFSFGGVKRWTIRYSTFKYICKKCKRNFIPTVYKNANQIYGHGLISWCIYQYVVNRQSYENIQKTLNDVFSISIPLMTIYDFKSDTARFYQNTYEKIISKISTGHLIHADETDIKLTKEKGYVWVFTNMEEAAFLYKPTREGDFLHELLKDFKGILVSDFYSAYDSINCPQQKCLVHLIRDINRDLLQNPFDEEFKEMISGFTTLLRKIIMTIDKYGLKRRNLNKHKIEVQKYLNQIATKKHNSDLAEKYQKRFKKNDDKLFTFLNYDGIPWNNNYAEHAIKTFAHYRALIDGRVSETGIKEYLVLLSVYQTCKYKGINFLDFLLSRESDIDRTFAWNAEMIRLGHDN
jgi:predicted RecB family nuclease